MPLNLVKTYCNLLELAFLDPVQRKASLMLIFKRDIEENPAFRFRGKMIRPIKGEEPNVQLLFTHLTCEERKIANPDGSTFSRREFEMDRSVRLHWIRHHIEERTVANIEVFSVSERDQKKRKDIVKTYIYDKVHQYIIVLEPQRSGTDYYLLTAYHLNRHEGRKSIQKKLKQRLPDVH